MSKAPPGSLEDSDASHPLQETDQGLWALGGGGTQAQWRRLLTVTRHAGALAVTFPFNHQSLTVEPLPGLVANNDHCGL